MRKVLGAVKRTFYEIDVNFLDAVHKARQVRKSGDLSGLVRGVQMSTAPKNDAIRICKISGVAPRIIIDLERGVRNTTLKTLEKIGRPFRLKLNFIRGTTFSNLPCLIHQLHAIETHSLPNLFLIL